MEESVVGNFVDADSLWMIPWVGAIYVVQSEIDCNYWLVKEIAFSLPFTIPAFQLLYKKSYFISFDQLL